MKRLRHPIASIREPFGKAGLIVAILALVMALVGGAYAATSDSGKATASAKGKPGPRGKTGKTGLAGPAGPAGPQGPAGAKGDAGTPGAAGSNGVSVTGTPVAAGQEGCAAGGVKYTSASGSNVVCNGKNGTNGQTGFTETLPPKKTETGVWGGLLLSPGQHTFPISFPIPLAEAPEPVIVENDEDSAAGCPGRGVISPPGEPGVFVPSTPEAEPGKLCIYLNTFEGAPTPTMSSVRIPIFEEESGERNWHFEIGKASTVGALLQLPCTGEPCQTTGSWAVTAPE
jgi:hypothetical protein